MMTYSMSLSDIHVANEKGTFEEGRAIEISSDVEIVCTREDVNGQSDKTELPLDLANSCCYSLLSI